MLYDCCMTEAGKAAGLLVWRRQSGGDQAGDVPAGNKDGLNLLAFLR